jgi:hypothetical protein
MYFYHHMFKKLLGKVERANKDMTIKLKRNQPIWAPTSMNTWTQQYVNTAIREAHLGAATKLFVSYPQSRCLWPSFHPTRCALLRQFGIMFQVLLAEIQRKPLQSEHVPLISPVNTTFSSRSCDWQLPAEDCSVERDDYSAQLENSERSLYFKPPEGITVQF